MNTKPSLKQRWETAQPTKTIMFWSCAACVAATIVVGFTWGGWTTGGTARERAQDAAMDSRNELASALCVDRFQAAGDAQAQMVALSQLSSWERGSFVKKGGWAAMPAGSQDTDQAARLCGDKIAAMDKPVAAAVTVN